MPLAETLKQKAGPLPVWGWAAVGTAGLAGYLIYRQKQSAAAAAAAAQQQPLDSSNLGTVPVSNLTTTGQPMPIQMGDTFVDVNDPTTVTNNPPPPPPPPSPIKKPPPPPTKKPPPPTTPPKVTPPPPKQQTVTVCPWPQWCGTLWGIAQHVYGNGALWPAIYNANKAKIGSNPNLIHAGTVLVIPPKPA
jgi:nucleoid-associated protein YgaU